MHQQVVVFDFDETLTTHDTLIDAFVFLSLSKGWRLAIKKQLFYLNRFFFRNKCYNNHTYKWMGVRLFWWKNDIKRLEDQAKLFFSTLKFHDLVIAELKRHLSEGNRVIVSSASFEIVLNPMLDSMNGKLEIRGAKLKIKKGKVVGLVESNYKERKRVTLSSNEIDVLYTDSYADLSLACISKQIVVVDKQGKMQFCETVEAFKEAVRKRLMKS